MGIRPSEQQDLKGPGNLLKTKCVQRDLGSQDTWQTTYRNVSLTFWWFWDSVRKQSTANKIQMFWVDTQGTLLFPGIYSPFHPEYTRVSPEISFSVLTTTLNRSLLLSVFCSSYLSILSNTAGTKLSCGNHVVSRSPYWWTACKHPVSFRAITTPDLFSMWL